MSHLQSVMPFEAQSQTWCLRSLCEVTAGVLLPSSASIILELSSPVGQRSYFEINGLKTRTLHTGGGSLVRTKFRIFITYKFICEEKIKISKPIKIYQVERAIASGVG